MRPPQVFYVEGGERYFLSPARCAERHPWGLVRTCSPARARRLGLTWDEADQAAHRALQAERKAERLRTYRHDPRTGQRRRVDQ